MAYHYFSGVYTADKIFRREFLKHIRDIGYEIVCLAPQNTGPEDEEAEDDKEYLVVSRQFQEDPQE